MGEKAKNIVIVCSASALDGPDSPACMGPGGLRLPADLDKTACKYPENGLLPEEQVEVAQQIVRRWAYGREMFVVVTVSPYILKAIEVAMDEHECGEDVVYVGPDWKELTSTQPIFRILSAPFSRLMHGEHYERSLPSEDGHGDK